MGTILYACMATQVSEMASNLATVKKPMIVVMSTMKTSGTR